MVSLSWFCHHGFWGNDRLKFALLEDHKGLVMGMTISAKYICLTTFQLTGPVPSTGESRQKPRETLLLPQTLREIPA
ncbi:hypothetical protein [Prochlorothrix hollandica]|uniref:hypothetical protein n=1 Tax=Prochlorothrix hollandica TaxID=1223 RepID=UPI0003608988|nr:hypothetical protein [Prochlorothrix hollandica]